MINSSTIIFITTAVVFIFLFELTNCQYPNPTIINNGLFIQITGTYLRTKTGSFNVKQIYFKATNTTPSSLYWQPTSDTTLLIDISNYQDPINLLVKTNVSICGMNQGDCSSLQSNQTVLFDPPPFCNQASWSVDAGVPTLTITGIGFPITSSTPTTSPTSTSTSSTAATIASQVIFQRGSEKAVSGLLTMLSSTRAVITLPFSSGTNYEIVSVTMNGILAVSTKTFSFNPPNITSIDCSSTTSCIIKGSSFGSTNNDKISINITLGSQYQLQPSTQQFGTTNTMDNITIASPIPFLLMTGSRIVTLTLDGNTSPPYLYYKSTKMINHTIDSTNITMIVSDACYTPSIQFGDINQTAAGVAQDTNNKIITTQIPVWARNGNVTLSCYGAACTPFPIKLTPTLNYSTSSNTSGTMITIYGQFISPLDSLNRAVSISIKTSSNRECTNASYVSDGVTTCVAPAGAGNSTTLSITIDGMSSPTTVPLMYNKPSISNYTYNSNTNTIYVNGFNFGDIQQSVSIRYNNVSYNTTHTVAHLQVMAKLDGSINETGSMELIVDGQSSVPLVVYLLGGTSGGGPTTIINVEGRDSNTLKWAVSVTIILAIVIIMFVVYVLFKKYHRAKEDNRIK